jgi:hypothetical protein
MEITISSLEREKGFSNVLSIEIQVCFKQSDVLLQTKAQWISHKHLHTDKNKLFIRFSTLFDFTACYNWELDIHVHMSLSLGETDDVIKYRGRTKELGQQLVIIKSENDTTHDFVPILCEVRLQSTSPNTDAGSTRVVIPKSPYVLTPKSKSSCNTSLSEARMYEVQKALCLNSYRKTLDAGFGDIETGMLLQQLYHSTHMTRHTLLQIYFVISNWSRLITVRNSSVCFD